MAELPDVFKEKEHGKMGFEAVPDVDKDGKKIQYHVMMVKSTLMKNKETEGKNLACQFKITDGEKKGRILFTRLNLINKNQTAVEIANNELADIIRACGKESIKDSEELHGIDILVEVSIIEETDTNPASNKIIKYISLGGSKSRNPFAKS